MASPHTYVHTQYDRVPVDDALHCVWTRTLKVGYRSCMLLRVFMMQCGNRIYGWNLCRRKLNVKQLLERGVYELVTAFYGQLGEFGLAGLG
jgi:hypothetical protein